MEYHFATLWESIADAIPDATAVTFGDTKRSWSAWDERSARLSAGLAGAGLGPDSKLGLYLYNSIEYCEAELAAFKLRGVPININYRYLDDELLYLIENSDSEAVVFHRSLGERVQRVMPRAPGVRLWIEVDDGGEPVPGAVAYEDVLAGHAPATRIHRSEDDVYMLYTGGTTGMPKGVVYAMGGMTRSFVALAFPTLGFAVPESAEAIAPLVRQAHDSGRTPVSVPACPLMHGTGAWIGAMMPRCAGANVVLLTSRSFDAHELWRVAQQERASQLVIVGDAFGRPMLTALAEAAEAGRPYDTSSLRLILSSGVMWSAEVKQGLLEWGRYLLYDAMGSSEGSMGAQVSGLGIPPRTARFALSETTKVFDEADREVVPGSGERGRVAAGGNVPLGYYKDPVQSAATFRVIDGVRYSFPGDWATVEADGTLTLLGRGSQCINTAGEKVFPEEVEEVLKLHPAIEDCLVVGQTDERYGERVCAVAARRPGFVTSAEELREFARGKLAAYKIPREIRLVDRVERAPNGKADYGWARRTLAGSS